MPIGQVAVEVLKEFFAADPLAANKLFSIRVHCNDAVANHPDIIVRPATEGGYEVGIIGLINGILMRYDNASPKVAAIIDGDDTLLGFEEYKPQP